MIDTTFSESNSRDVPVVPLPPIVGDPPATPGDDFPVTPLPPIVGNPDMGAQPPAANPGDNIPVVPLPPIVGNPEQPPASNPDSIPVIPLPPIVGNPDTGAQPPAYPGPYPGYCTVRFLHATANYEPVRVIISNRVIVSNLSYGNMTSYSRISDGFRTVTITSARYPRTILYQQTIPFHAGEIITLAIIRTNNGIDLERISDTPCSNRPRNRACIRMANLVYNSPALDLILNEGRVVFTDVRYKEVTTFKQALPKEYDFYIAQTPYMLSPTADDIETLENMPVILPNYYLPGYGDISPLVSFYVDARAGSMYTIYVLGNWNNSSVVRVKIVENR